MQAALNVSIVNVLIEFLGQKAGQLVQHNFRIASLQNDRELLLSVCLSVCLSVDEVHERTGV